MSGQREQITIPEAIQKRDAAVANSNQLSDRWTLSLAVANGGGILAVSSQLMSKDVTVEIASSLLPAAWAFAVGLILVGLGKGLAHYSALFSALGFEWIIKKAKQTGRAGVGDTSLFFESLFWGQVVAEVVAAAAFIGGVTYPLLTYPFPTT